MPRVRGTWGAPNASSTPSASKPQASGNQAKAWSPKLGQCTTIYDDASDTDRYNVVIDWIKGTDIPNIVNKWNDVIGQYKGVLKVLPNKDNKSITIKFPVDLLTTFSEKYLNTLLSIIEQCGGYNKMALTTIKNTFEKHLASIATKEDINNMNTNVAKTWTEMLQKLNDPEFRKKLLSYEISSEYRAKYGNVLTPRNVQMVLSQKPDASFVTDAETWRSKYNRTVNQGAQRIIIQKPTNSYLSQKELDAAAVASGYKSYKDAMIRTKNSQQVIHAIRSQANKMANRPVTFMKTIVYDVSETTPIPRLRDIWTEEIGLLDNLRGTLNPLAQQQQDMDNSGTTNPQTATQGANASADLNLFARKIVSKVKASGVKFDASAYANDSAVIINAAHQFALANCAKYNVLKDSNQNKIAAAVTAIVAATLDINTSSIVQRFMQLYNGKVTENEAVIAFNVYTDLVPSITKSNNMSESKNMLKEGINSASDFMSALESLGINVVKDDEAMDDTMPMESKENDAKKNITESFNKMLDRINKSIIY